MMIPKIKKYVMDESLTWEQRYNQLESHHELETNWLIVYADALEKQNDRNWWALWNVVWFVICNDILTKYLEPNFSA